MVECTVRLAYPNAGAVDRGSLMSSSCFRCGKVGYFKRDYPMKLGALELGLGLAENEQGQL